MEVTEGTLLDGRIRYRQPASGHRTGIEPVLLAAAVPARSGDRVLEGGTGAGAALLCLAQRVPGVAGLGVEREPALAALAAANFALNGQTSLQAAAGDIAALAEGPFDHAMANPPWHAASGTHSPDALREQARRAAQDTARIWTISLGRALRPAGTLSLILSTAALPGFLAALPDAGCGSPALTPLWPRAGQPARLVLLQAVRGGRAALRLSPGLILHAHGPGFSAAADAILRSGASLQAAMAR